MLICRPREVDLLAEIPSPPGTFSVNEDCVYTESEVKCSVVSDFDLVLTLTSPAKRESLLQAIPTLGDRILRTLKLGDADLALATRIVKVVVDHRLGMLNGVSLADPFAGIIELAESKPAAQAEFEGMMSLARKDRFSEVKFVEGTAAILKVVPALNHAASELNFESLAEP
jgi:hypothetical protein